MTKIILEQLIWDDWNTGHIKKHKVTRAEVEEAIQRVKTHEEVKNGRFLLIGRAGSRLLSVILSQEEGNKYYVVTARDAARKERKHFYEEDE